MKNQEKIKALLDKLPLAKRAIKVFGSQIHITCLSLTTANKWASEISNFAKVMSVAEGLDENKTSSGQIEYTPVFRIWAVI